MQSEDDESEDDGFGPKHFPPSVAPVCMSTVASDIVVVELTASELAMNRMIDQQLNHAQSQHTNSPYAMPWKNGSVVRMPWQAGRDKFSVGGEDLQNYLKIDSILLPPDVITPEPPMPVQTILRIAAGRLLPGLVKLIKDVPWPQQLVAKRHAAMTMW